MVVPDLPGYGYSDRPTGPPLNSIDVAGLWAELMNGLGYDRFGAAGGDIGSHVSRYLALDHPDRVVAVHRTDAGVPVFAGDPADLTPEERAWLEDAAAWGATEGAYAAMHRTKPQTAAVGLTDSPAGLAAWIVEKLRAWSDCDGDIERRFTKDEILTNVMIYWLTGTIGSSMRMYHANAAIPPAQHARRVEVPSGFALFPGDIVRPPRAWLERTANVVRVTEPAARRALRAVRGARALRRGAARLLPSLPRPDPRTTGHTHTSDPTSTIVGGRSLEHRHRAAGHGHDGAGRPVPDLDLIHARPHGRHPETATGPPGLPLPAVAHDDHDAAPRGIDGQPAGDLDLALAVGAVGVPHAVVTCFAHGQDSVDAIRSPT